MASSAGFREMLANGETAIPDRPARGRGGNGIRGGRRPRRRSDRSARTRGGGRPRTGGGRGCRHPRRGWRRHVTGQLGPQRRDQPARQEVAPGDGAVHADRSQQVAGGHVHDPPSHPELFPDALVAAPREPGGLAGHRALDGVRLVAGGEQHDLHARGPLEGDTEHRPHLLADDVVGGVARHVSEGEQGHDRTGRARGGRRVGAGRPRGGRRRRRVGAGGPCSGGHGRTADGAAPSGSAGTPHRRGAARGGGRVRRRHAGIPPAGARRPGRAGRGAGRGRAGRGGVPGGASAAQARSLRLGAGHPILGAGRR